MALPRRTQKKSVMTPTCMALRTERAVEPCSSTDVIVTAWSAEWIAKTLDQ